ncbi:putative acid phosphatase [Zopfia rhizophila CBS 207.26]|uniref:3-phytase n=1 Tax=Zopfia rhizophila CBS 207.26 TaxID=1314779 RepID=A0A6A6E220_9PEZI|nr:putative acid phosphatase [Zopfia rhizophila CBS 207.26]
MTSLVPHPPYDVDELRKLYPSSLVLQQVQIFFRHGERTPTSARFEHIGLPPFWSQCAVGKLLSTTALTDHGKASWTPHSWKRSLETFGPNDSPVNPSDNKGSIHSLCGFGELTDIGRHSILELGHRLRHLYVDQLNFMPKTISDPSTLYLRASPYTRTLESTHQAFLGLYPQPAQAQDFTPHVFLRMPKDETLMPNEDHCERFIQLMKAYSRKTAERWNDSSEVEYLNKLLRRYMPSQRRVAVDSKPRLSGVYDTVNATLGAQDPNLRLPSAFYDSKARNIMDKIAFEEEFGGLFESAEFRLLGIGSLLGDIVQRMTTKVDAHRGVSSPSNPSIDPGTKMVLSGGHDSTVIGILAALGALVDDDISWPRYSASVAIELFRKNAGDQSAEPLSLEQPILSWLPLQRKSPTAIGRTASSELREHQKKAMDGYFVRIRYNDRPVIVPGCRAVGKHLPGEESFCTLAAFKAIVDKMTPGDWRKSCVSNLNKPAVPAVIQPAGF